MAAGSEELLREKCACCSLLIRKRGEVTVMYTLKRVCVDFKICQSDDIHIEYGIKI